MYVGSNGPKVTAEVICNLNLCVFFIPEYNQSNLS